MWIQRTAGTALLVVMTGLPAMAQPIEIATLGRAPVWHQPAFTIAQAQDHFQKNETAMHRAARSLGLTESQFTAFRNQLLSDKGRWVTLPRHLDAMTYGSPAQRLNDVIIPAGEKGVEIDLPDGDATLALYLPARCGNLSFVRRRLAALPNPHPLVAAAQNPYPAPQEIPPPALVSAVIPVVNCVGPPGVCSPLPPGGPAICRFGPLCILPAVIPFLVRGGSNTTPGTPFTPTASIVGPPPPACP